MGWSCTVDAMRTYRDWESVCRAQTGSQNAYVTTAGRQRFFEDSRREYADGRITGAVYEYVGEDRARLIGRFCIRGDGSIARAPAGLLTAR